MGALTQRQLAEKDEVHLDMTDLATAGELNEFQLQDWREILIGQSRLLGQSTVDYVKQKKGKYEYAGFISEILYPVDEHDEVPVENYSEPALVKVPFECVEYAGAIPLSDTVLRNNLARERFGPFLLTTAGKGVALDIEKLSIQSSESSLDNRYKKFDGLLYQPISHVLNPETAAAIDPALMYQMQIAMPSKYWRDIPNMRYYCSPHSEQTYVYNMASKTAETGYRFTLEDNGFRMTYGGVPVFPLEGIPDGYMILTHKDNVVIVIEEQVTWEFEREPKKRRTLFHVHNSFYATFAVEDAVVLHKNVAVPVASTV